MEHILEKLTTEQLQSLYAVIHVVLTKRLGPKMGVRTKDFKIGQVVQFMDSNGGIVKMRVDRINSKSVSGTQIGTLKKWRVSPSLLTPV